MIASPARAGPKPAAQEAPAAEQLLPALMRQVMPGCCAWHLLSSHHRNVDDPAVTMQGWQPLAVLYISIWQSYKALSLKSQTSLLVECSRSATLLLLVHKNL